MRQVTLKLHTQQTLQTYTPKNEYKVEKECTEYMVLQKQMIRGEEQEWKIWGFAEGLDVPGLEKEIQKQEDTIRYHEENKRAEEEEKAREQGHLGAA